MNARCSSARHLSRGTSSTPPVKPGEALFRSLRWLAPDGVARPFDLTLFSLGGVTKPVLNPILRGARPVQGCLEPALSGRAAHPYLRSCGCLGWPCEEERSSFRYGLPIRCVPRCRLLRRSIFERKLQVRRRPWEWLRTFTRTSGKRLGQRRVAPLCSIYDRFRPL